MGWASKFTIRYARVRIGRIEMTDPATAASEAATVRKARRDEAGAICRTLTRAFFDDPVTSWFMPERERRAKQLPRAFRLGIRHVYMPHEESYVTEGGVGAALWHPPGTWEVGVGRQLLMLPALIRAYGRDLSRSLRGFNLITAEHPRRPPHWYLPFIGVDPDWQGRGIGTALLRPVLDRCDREGMPAYLEASTPRNRACYERNGFEVTGTITLPDGPPLWKMWREPGA